MKFSATRLCSALINHPPALSERNADTQNANTREWLVIRNALRSAEVASLARVLAGG